MNLSSRSLAPATGNARRIASVGYTGGARVAWFWRTSLGRALLITLAWRLLFAACGVIAHYAFPRGTATTFSLIRAEHWPANVVTLAIDSAARYDSVWYAHIALHGYSYSTQHVSSIGFYPLYPILIKLVALVVGNVYVAGLLVSTICLFGAVILLHVWLNSKALGARTPLVVVCMLSYPYAVFYGAMYSETLFLFLVLATFVCFEEERWKLASACVFLALLARPTGIVMLPSLALLAFSARSWTWGRFLPFISAGAAIVGFAAYQYARFGTPLAYAHSKAFPPWSATPGRAVQDLMLRGRFGIPSWYLGFMLAITLLFLAFVPLVYRRFGPAYALFAALSVLVFLGSGLVGMNRYVIVDFPVFAVIACTRHTKILLGVLTVNFWLMLLVVAAFATGWGIF